MINSSTSLTKDLARHLFARGEQGRVAIVTDNPTGLHAALRKQWMTLLRQVQRERASTLQSARILVLSSQISWMQHIAFTRSRPDKQQADIHILTPQDYLEARCPFEALYLTNGLQPTLVELCTARMQRGIVVAYQLQTGVKNYP